MHVHQPVSQVCKPDESLALREVKHPLNGRTSVSRLPLTKQDILSQYSSCFEGICRATMRPPRPSSTAECLRLIARLRGEQASAASWGPRPPFEATEMD